MKICIVDERISSKCERGLLREGFRIIKLPPAPNVSEAIASHTDIVIFCHGKRIITSADYCEKFPYVFTDIRECSDSVDFTFTDDVQGGKYPHDAIFNALAVGNKIFLKTDTASSAISDYARRHGLFTVHTSQGYPACTALAFGGCAVTADAGMERVLRDEGISVLRIGTDGVLLPPYEYGFIGGAAGVFENKVYFLGDISTHPDGGRICEFIHGAGYIPHSLSDEPLSDLGGLRFLL